MQKNIKIGYLLAFINELYLPIAVWLLFFLQHLSFTQVAFLGALSTISSNLFEIPTGAIGDTIGRRWTLFWSFALSAAGLIIIAMGDSLLVFALGRIINGFATSLFSGTHESLMYDSLKSIGKSDTFDEVTSKVESFAWIGLFCAAIGGGYLYDAWPTSPFIVSALIYAATAGVCLLLKEPGIDSYTFNLKVYLKQNAQGFTELFKDKKTTQLSLLMITVSAGYFFGSKILGISQAEEYGLSGKGIGLLFGVGYIAAAISSYYYPTLRRKFGNSRLLALACAALISSYILAPFVGVIAGSMLIMFRISSSTSFGNAKSVIMNRYISSNNRATALSTLTLLSEIPFTLSFYWVGMIIESTSANQFAALLGLILALLLLPQVWSVRRMIEPHLKIGYP